MRANVPVTDHQPQRPCGGLPGEPNGTLLAAFLPLTTTTIIKFVKIGSTVLIQASYRTLFSPDGQ